MSDDDNMGEGGEAPESTDPKFGLGYKQDEPDARDLVSEQLLGAPARADAIMPASMMAYRKGYLYQGSAGSCVAHAIDRANDMFLRRDCEQKGIDASKIPKASRRFIYYNARRQEAVDAARAGKQAPQIADNGCFPRLAMRAVQKLGFCDEAIMPYSDDPAQINEPPSALAARAAYDQKDFRYYRVQSAGAARVAEVARGLARGNPFIFGMFVDTAFMQNKGTQITSINTRDPNGGGHMLCGLEVKLTPDDVIFDNWWSDLWGAGGLGRMSHALFGSPVVTDVYIIEGVPLFSGKAA